MPNREDYYATRAELTGVTTMLTGLEARIDRIDSSTATMISAAINEAVVRMSASTLSEDERAWVKLALQAQAQRVKLRQAVIEKTFSGLILFGLSCLAYLIVDYLRNHGLRV